MCLDSTPEYQEWDHLTTIPLGTMTGWIYQIEDRNVIGILVRGELFRLSFD